MSEGFVSLRMQVSSVPKRFSCEWGHPCKHCCCDDRYLQMMLLATNCGLYLSLERPLVVSQSPVLHLSHAATNANMSVDSRRLKDFLASRPLPTLRILVLGAPGSGKRSTCERLAHGVFPIDRDPTEDGQYRRVVQLFPPEEGREFRVMLE